MRCGIGKVVSCPTPTRPHTTAARCQYTLLVCLSDASPTTLPFHKAIHKAIHHNTHQHNPQTHRQQELKAADQELHQQVVPVFRACTLSHAFEHVEQVEQPAGQAQGAKGGTKGVIEGGAQAALGGARAGGGKVPE